MYKVHIGYGFHVNCYHSYRGDANDATGFGGDIRVIRRVIEILNGLNERGIPVKGTWDFENAFSLEDILPKYAPDIIEGVRERVERRGDENIIMGYNNGALGAMTRDEFDASVQWAVTNPWGSGLADLFGACERIVRPQEVMFSPPQVRDYRRCGIEALCLYYSCVPFDAFNTIVPRLRDALAFNPLTFTYEGESLTVLPSYSNADLIDAGSLRALAKDLHARQLSGEIKTDVFIFVNMDADAFCWEPFDLPAPLNRLANTQGILGLVEEVAELDFVEFNTPGGYLKNHPPLGEISFGHDTADGSYTGWSSWAEKPFNRLLWSRVEKARALAKTRGLDADSPGFRERILLLSTTHFGLASPVLNIDRERGALALSETMLRKELDALERPGQLTLVNLNNSCLAGTELCFAPGWLTRIERLGIAAEGLASFGAVTLDTHADGSVASAYALCRFDEAFARAEISVTNGAEIPSPPSAPSLRLEAGGLSLAFCAHGEVLSVKYNGKAIGGRDFLRSFLSYGKQNYPMTAKRCAALPAAGQLRGLRVEGELHLPEELSPGQCQFDFFTLPGVGGVIVRMNARYPRTEESYTLSTQSSALGRYYDVRWRQAAPFQLTPRLPGELHVVKRNFAEDISDYPIASFRESVPENESLDSFNHQLTGGFVGLSNGESGLLLANARQLLGSMAHCPMRLRRQNGQDLVRLNPFGTYAGRQRLHHSRGNGSVCEAFVIVAPQSRSLAPAYNGAEETAVLALFGFEGLRPGEAVTREACAFADGAVLLAPEDSPVWGADMRGHAATGAAQALRGQGEKQKLRSPLFSGVLPGPLRMAGVGIRALGQMLRAQWKAR
ncbi:MAG: hypothetical protein FWH26_06925 [Oscillospiraceae bacterium]|nr:hypothetical protein [Oscillospiraceae bacterium]